MRPYDAEWLAAASHIVVAGFKDGSLAKVEFALALQMKALHAALSKACLALHATEGIIEMKAVLALATALIVPAAAIAAEIGGTWQGSYTCNQGLTGLTLTITPANDGATQGVFRFYQVDGNPGVPDGCFAMSGTVSGDRIMLQAGKWLYRPFGYVTVDLAGTVSPDDTAMMGSIFGPNCTTFMLRRVPGNSTPAACRLPDAPVS